MYFFYFCAFSNKVEVKDMTDERRGGGIVQNNYASVDLGK